MRKITTLIAGLLTLTCTAITSSAQAPRGDISTLSDGTTDCVCKYEKIEMLPGQEAVLCELDGAGALKYFYLTDGPDNMTDETVVLRIYWDGCDFPSVNVPLCDFFGIMGGRPVEWLSKYICVHHCDNQCYFPMPFSKGVRIALYNDGDKPYSKLLAFGFDFEMSRSYKHCKSRFHACFNRSNPTVDGLHTILDVQGHGQYVGNILHVYSATDKYWAEGDTDFVLDSRTIKHTPGTEDEYGSCYDLGFKFNQYLCGYIEGGLADPNARWGSHKGHNRLYRFYDSNPVRFRKGLKVTMQNQYYDAATDSSLNGADDYMSTAYYYLEGAHPVSLMPYSQRTAPSEAINY